MFSTLASVAISALLLLLLAANSFGQCGNYFKTNYRAVDKVGYTDANGFFLLADWTGDGRSDFWGFRPDQNNSAVNIVIYPGKSTGYWDWDHPIILSTSLPVATTTTGGFFVIRDFNSDGMMDLFRFDSFGNGIVYKNSGSGSLVQLAVNNSFGNYVGFADINGDGFVDWIDWINAPNQGHSLGYRLLTADGTFGPRVDVLTGTQLLGASINVGDYNGDGRPDIIYVGSGRYTSLINTGGSFALGVDVSGRAWSEFYDQADFNNDGRTDFLAAATFTSPQRLFVLISEPNGSFAETEVGNVSDYLSEYRIADFDGDNNKDIIQFSANRYSMYINNGSGNFVKTDYFRSLTNTPGNLVFEDFSGDNKADLWDRGQSNVFNEFVILIKENTCQSFGETKRLNFDGNYFGDLVMWNGTSGKWSSINGRWAAEIPPPIFANWGSSSLGDIPAPGDFDGDGRSDYAVFRNGEGNWYILLSSTSTWLVTHFGLPNDIPVPNDFDGGGRSDIAVFRPSEGNWYIWHTESQSFSAVHFGSNSDKPVPSDFDGDGKTDVAVFRPSEGNWYWLKSSDGNWGVVHWGIGSDIPVPGDFDGDGKTDPTIYRNVNGAWYVLRSSNGSYGVFNWGTSGDIPFAFNREGDLSEIVVYRPSQGWWYNLRYSVQFVYVIQFGGPGDSPVNLGFPLN
jgi:hypothetical protein